MIKRYLLFSQITCTKCPAVKEFLKTIDIPGDEIDATNDDGFEEARKYLVMSTPTLIFYDESEKEIGRALSLEELKAFLQKNKK